MILVYCWSLFATSSNKLTLVQCTFCVERNHTYPCMIYHDQGFSIESSCKLVLRKVIPIQLQREVLKSEQLEKFLDIFFLVGISPPSLSYSDSRPGVREESRCSYYTLANNEAPYSIGYCYVKKSMVICINRQESIPSKRETLLRCQFIDGPSYQRLWFAEIAVYAIGALALHGPCALLCS